MVVAPSIRVDPALNGEARIGSWLGGLLNKPDVCSALSFHWNMSWWLRKQRPATWSDNWELFCCFSLNYFLEFSSIGVCCNMRYMHDEIAQSSWEARLGKELGQLRGQRSVNQQLLPDKVEISYTRWETAWARPNLVSQRRRNLLARRS